jgi:hypothetical protein
MGTIQSSAVVFPQNKPLSTLHGVETLESKIAAAAAEMDFYHKLLSWLLFSCHEDKRHTIETFKRELADLRSGGFSALREGLERLKNEAQGEMGQPDLNSDIAYLRVYLNHTEVALQSLKSRIHRGFSDFIHVCIW